MSHESLNEILSAEEFSVVFVGATWCGYCTKFKPIFDDVAKLFGAEIKFFKVDVQEEVDFPKLHGINGFPTTLLMKKGKVVGKAVGYMEKEAFTAKIAEFFN